MEIKPNFQKKKKERKKEREKKDFKLRLVEKESFLHAEVGGNNFSLLMGKIRKSEINVSNSFHTVFALHEEK